MADKGSKKIQRNTLETGSGSGWTYLKRTLREFLRINGFSYDAFSEFMPAPWVGIEPYGEIDPFIVPAGDNFGIRVSEYQEYIELREGIADIGRRMLAEFRKLFTGGHQFSKTLMANNIYLPETADGVIRIPKNERCTMMFPLALSRTLDDKGRLRWTLFGASEEGPAASFWKSFYASHGTEIAPGEGVKKFCSVLERLIGSGIKTAQDLKKIGFCILPVGRDPDFDSWTKEEIPSCLAPFVMSEKASLANIKIILTFRPFKYFPQTLKEVYLSGKISVVPFPGSLIFFGHTGYRALSKELDSAMQIPFLHLLPGARASNDGIRIPQSGWLDEPRKSSTEAEATEYKHGPVVSKIKRTSRFDRFARDEDETLFIEYADKVSEALFNSSPENIGLYGKPMAKNIQIWTHDYRLLLDGAREGREKTEEAARAIKSGGHFGYRFYFPPMRAGGYEIVWHRPIYGVFSQDMNEPLVFSDNLVGWMRAEPASKSTPEKKIVDLWPKIDARTEHLCAISLYCIEKGKRKFTTTYNIRKILEAYELLGGKHLDRLYARSLLTIPKDESIEDWLSYIESSCDSPEKAHELVNTLRSKIAVVTVGNAPARNKVPDNGLTFEMTANRKFEETYWKTIQFLSEGKYSLKNNADLAGTHANLNAESDLGSIGSYLIGYYRELIARCKMEGKAVVGSHWFRWSTQFDYPWSGGWARNQTGHTRERNIIVVIPGKSRKSAVIMGDHYDTAYMEDVYAKTKDGEIPLRKAASGADDNYSATSTLMLAAEIFLRMSARGELDRDIWLVHLTGEEFPSDCLGARALVSRLVENNLAIDADTEGRIELRDTRVFAAYILDMIAHNNDRDRNVFQISPGEGAASALASTYAHEANVRWNGSARIRNESPERKDAKEYERVKDVSEIPAIARYPELAGEVRPKWHFASSHFNTDAQMFSEAGIPVALIMEDYDINRHGYHDTQDTMINIDLDYGAALAAISIETVAIAATAK
jgi:hypothetical protein